MSKGSGTGGRAPSESCDFLLLPRDMLLYLARFLDAPDLGALARCNKQLRDFYSQGSSWPPSAFYHVLLRLLERMFFVFLAALILVSRYFRL